MNKDELIRKFIEWRDNDENEKIAAAVLALPESSVDDEILSWLAQAYIDIGEFKRAIAVLESLHARMENDYKWQFMMGLALLRVSDDDECDDDEELRVKILERAKVCLARGMNMNPPEDTLDGADRIMEEVEMRLDEIDPAEDDYDDDIEAYDDDELDVLEEHIKEYFGDFPTVFHEMTSKDFICDIACIPPTKERNYFTLVTMGMGAHVMNIPDTLPADENGRAELLICLPPDWKLGENAEEWFWPITLLKDLAKLPINTDSWLGWGHSVDHCANVSFNTKFCGSLLIYPEGAADGAESCTLPNGDKVSFFEVIPMYREEMIFKVNNNTKALLERMKNVSHIVDINRPNCCEDYDENEQLPAADGTKAFDSADMHSEKITEKGLKLDEINGCNHIAVFMRWCIEHGLEAPMFRERCPEIVKGVKDGTQTDLRAFIMDYFDGFFASYQLSYIGACFCDYYYNWDRRDPKHFFPHDVDDYAEKYFGTERYNCEEFQDEAYMFVPFDEEYYRGLSEYIDRAFADFLPEFAKERRADDLNMTEQAKRILGTECFLPEYSEVKSALRDAAYKAKMNGHSALPIIIDRGGVINEQDEFTALLEDAADPLLETVAIAEFPCADPVEWARERSDGEKPALIRSTERMTEMLSLLSDMTGASPAVLAFDENGASLLLPLDNGDYIQFTIDG